MQKRASIHMAEAWVATLLAASFLGSGCLAHRHSDFVFPLSITGAVVDAQDGAALSDVYLEFESDSIRYPDESLIGFSADGTIDIDYLLAFGRKQRRGLNGYKSPEDTCRIVLTRDGYVPAVFEFRLNELDGECEHPIDLGNVVLSRD